MHDPRNKKLAEVFINHSLNVKAGDKVVISSSDLEAIDLIREVYQLALIRGAYVYLDIMGSNFLLDRTSAGDLVKVFYEHASDDQILNPPDIYKSIFEWGDKYVRITSLENYSFLTGVDPAKLALREKSRNEWFDSMVDNKDWVLTYYPTQGMAQQAGMSLSELTDFYFASTVVDYEEMEAKGAKVCELIDSAKEVRIIGEKTNLLINIDGRLGDNSAGHANVPDGEVFCAPNHLLTEGFIYYDVPFSRPGGEINGAYLEFEEGRVVKASAESGEDFLLQTLDTDEGARYLGELGIGLNYGITKPMKNTLFDEKIGGTVHVTLGSAYPYERGGAPNGAGNKSVIHWDLVKDMRKSGSVIEIDGVVAFREGEWLI